MWSSVRCDLGHYTVSRVGTGDCVSIRREYSFSLKIDGDASGLVQPSVRLPGLARLRHEPVGGLICSTVIGPVETPGRE